MNLCANCQKPTPNPRFCSRSCAAQVTNREAQKRQRKINYCASCGGEMPLGRDYSRRKYCAKCRIEQLALSSKTIGQIRATGTNRHGSIREQARKLLLANGVLPVCKVCGYNHYVEACHIQPLQAFPDDTLVSVVNDLANLIFLCPNCHWELDHGLLVIAS